MLDLAALDFVVVEVYIIEEFVGESFGHIATITSSYDAMVASLRAALSVAKSYM